MTGKPKAALDKGAASGADASDDERSLLDDIEALIHDGRLYFDAEISYQKTRASFISDRLKKTVIFGIVAFILAILAVLGLVVGSLIALAPLIGGWGATGVVVGTLLLVVVICGLKARSSAKSMIAAVRAEKAGKAEKSGGSGSGGPASGADESDDA